MPVYKETRIYYPASDSEPSGITKIKKTRELKPGEAFPVESAIIVNNGTSSIVRGRGTVDAAAEKVELTFWDGHTDRSKKATLTGLEINESGVTERSSKTFPRRRLKETVIIYDYPTPEPTATKI